MSRGAKLRPVLQPAGAALALPLLLHVCDDVVIGHRDGAAGTVITMHFDLAAHDLAARGEPVRSWSSVDDAGSVALRADDVPTTTARHPS
jgi:hypothetical protein